MTREDAIVILKDIQDNLEETRFLKRCAIDMAIEALQENESLAKSVNEASELLRKKRPQGIWIEIEDEYGTTYLGCSRCSWENEHRLTHWVACPNCGASMRKEGE